MMSGSIEHDVKARTAGDLLSGSVGLRNYYFVRAAFAAAWVGAAFTLGKAPLAATALLIAYPAWDAIANLFDISRNGGAARNLPQTLNVAISGIEFSFTSFKSFCTFGWMTIEQYGFFLRV